MNELGVSETIQILNFTETQLYESIKNMLETKKYSQTAKKLSQALQDRPMTPIEEATYWTEWVIRNPDIDLEGAAADLNLFARHSLDVFALIFFEIILFVYLDVKFIIWIIKRCFRKSPKPKVSDKKKKN
jgi:glucuronosyltransferase